MEVRDVENLPAELQAVAFPRHLPALAQGHIQTGVAIPANHISRTAFAGERMPKVVESRRRIGENADGTGVRIPVMPDLGSGDHLTDTLLAPVRRPEVAVIKGEGESTRPPSQARKLPTSDQSIANAVGVAGEVLALAERQLGNPVEIDLVGGVEIRDSPAPVRIECIRQASSGRSYVATRCPRETSRGRGDIDRPGIRVVEVELHPTAELLPQVGLKRVVVRFADGAPGEHAGRLVVQVIAEPRPKGRLKGPRPRGSTSRSSAEGIEIA